MEESPKRGNTPRCYPSRFRIIGTIAAETLQVAMVTHAKVARLTARSLAFPARVRSYDPGRFIASAVRGNRGALHSYVAE